MKKKFLCIVAVAFLGIGAAFATTTSTVYFTTSGTLTKYEDVLDGVIQTDNDPSNGSRNHDGEINIGVAKVFTSFELNDNTYKATGVYMGEEVTKDDSVNPLKVTYSRTGRVANPDNSSAYSLTNPPYVYRELYLENLKFSKAGDHYFIPVYAYSYCESQKVMYYMNDLGMCYSKTTNVVDVFTQPKTINLTSDYTCTYYFINHRNPIDNSTLKASSGVYTGFWGNPGTLLYLYIYVTKDFEGDYNTKFNNVTITSLPFNTSFYGTNFTYYMN